MHKEYTDNRLSKAGKMRVNNEPSDASSASHVTTDSKPTGPSNSKGTKLVRASSWAFVLLVFTLFLIPLVGIPFYKSDASAENSELASWPDFIVDGKPNTKALAGAGDWFNDHFAFRQQALSANARLRAALLNYSSTDAVAMGTDGWMYFGSEMKDWRRSRPQLSNEEDIIVNNVALIQEYVQSRGSRFVFTVAPNKSTIYPEHLPYYEPKGSGMTHLERMAKRFNEGNQVNFVDLSDALLKAKADSKQDLYYTTDSHWNPLGARVGWQALAPSLGKSPSRFKDAHYVDHSRVGDLAGMLYMIDVEPEQTIDLDNKDEWEFTNGATSTSGNGTIKTKSLDPDATGSLLAYRDSFGTALAPYLAEGFKECTFVGDPPYDFTLVEKLKPSYVLLERVERSLNNFSHDPAIYIMPAPKRTGLELSGSSVRSDSKIEIGTYDPMVAPNAEIPGMVRVSGSIDPSIKDVEKAYVTTSSGKHEGYEAFVGYDTQAEEQGKLVLEFSAYIPAAELENGKTQLGLVVDTGNGLETIAVRLL